MTGYLSHRKFGAALVPLILCSCAHDAPGALVFDVPHVSAEANLTEQPETSQTTTGANGATEAAPGARSTALLGSRVTVGDYAVDSDASADDRFFIYHLKFEGETYNIAGTALMQKHLQELDALQSLRKKNKAVLVARGGWNAISSPVVGTANAITSPVSTAKKGYSSINNAVKSVGEKISFSRKDKEQTPKLAEREKDGMIGKLLGKPDARRRLAYDLKVDPYTHFVPLRNELDKSANFHAAGQLGIKGGLGLVPGVGGILISSASALDGLTKETLYKSPKEMAKTNAKRLTAVGLDNGPVKKFVESVHYTPTEKTLVTGSLLQLKDVSGFASLLRHAAEQNQRTHAFAVFEELELIRRKNKTGLLDHIDVVAGLPVLGFADGSYSIIAAYDQFAWTPRNADTMNAAATWLARNHPKAGGNTTVIVSGRLTRLSATSLKRLRLNFLEKALHQ